VNDQERITTLNNILKACRLCPRACLVDRTEGQRGACQIGYTPLVASAAAHFGEEPPLVGNGGSGAIFFAGCNLACLFCQNHDISQTTAGQPCTPHQLAHLACDLADQGCVNINFVSPTHVAHAVAEAIVIARNKGLSLPTVYNSGGYDSVETLRLLKGLIDIYMPDFKYDTDQAGRTYSGAPCYPKVASAALKEMFRQVGPLQVNEKGLATKGLLVRHLVMPPNIVDSNAVIDIVARLAPGSTINIMAQYHPAYHARQFPQLLQPPSPQTVQNARDYARQRGLVVLAP